jgi:hypothetical protein
MAKSVLGSAGSMHGPRHRTGGTTTIERTPRRPGLTARERGAVSRNRERRLHDEGEREEWLEFVFFFIYRRW